MKDDKNKNFIKKTRGLILIWVIALPLSLMLYSTFERTSITILAFAIVASVFVAILFPSKNIFSKQHKKIDIVTTPLAPSMDIKDEENYKQFLKRTRGILSIWIIAAPFRRNGLFRKKIDGSIHVSKQIHIFYYDMFVGDTRVWTMVHRKILPRRL